MPQPFSGNTFNADDAMTAINGTPLTYDADGNLTGDDTDSYTRDTRNHLSAISGGAAASLVHDAFGRRASKTITPYLYDGLNPVQDAQNGSPSANLVTGLNVDEYFSRTDASLHGQLPDGCSREHDRPRQSICSRPKIASCNSLGNGGRTFAMR